MTIAYLGIGVLGVELGVAAQGLQLHHASAFHHGGTYSVEQIAGGDQGALYNTQHRLSAHTVQ